MFLTHTAIEPAGFYNMWECYVMSDDNRYYTEIGWPSYRGRGTHHVIIMARNAKSAKRKLDRLIRKAEKKYNY